MNATSAWLSNDPGTLNISFNGHPPLGVNATELVGLLECVISDPGFNGHPPLGVNATKPRPAASARGIHRFNGHPPLGVNATLPPPRARGGEQCGGFNGHPPLGVNATGFAGALLSGAGMISFNGHPPLGVNATRVLDSRFSPRDGEVSMGTHPWG